MKIRTEIDGRNIAKYFVFRTEKNKDVSEYLQWNGTWGEAKYYFNTYHNIQRALELERVKT